MKRRGFFGALASLCASPVACAFSLPTSDAAKINTLKIVVDDILTEEKYFLGRGEINGQPAPSFPAERLSR